MAHDRSKRVKVPSGLQVRAAIAQNSFDEKAGTVEVVFSTGSRGKRYSYDEGPYFEELEISEAAVDLARLSNGAPVLAAHDSYRLNSVIGVVERAWLVPGEARALLRFSEREDVKPLKADVQNGILRHISVGYSIQRMEKVEEVDGVPVYRATKWTPAEISFVPMGFDDRAVVRSADDKQQFVEVELAEREQEKQMPNEMPVAPAVPAAPVAPAVDVDAERKSAAESAVKAERERMSGIRSLASKYKLGDEFVTAMVERGASLQDAKNEVLERLAAQSDAAPIDGHVRVEAGATADEKFLKAAESAIIVRAGKAELVARGAKESFASDKLRNFVVAPNELARLSAVGLAGECLEMRGISTRRMTAEDIMRKALTTRGGYNATGDFPVLLESAMGKVLEASYAAAEHTWRNFCRVVSAPDFRAINFYRKGMFGTLDEVAENGEFKRKNIPDGEKLSATVHTYGNTIAISRAALINDDLGAFMNLASEFGESAGNTIEAAVYALLAANAGLGPTQTDASPFFDSAARGNVGGGNAISVAALVADAALMRRQTDPSGSRSLNIRPAVLLVPLELEGTANSLNQAKYEPTAQMFEKPNECLGMFRTVVGSASLGAATTRRYMFADPSVIAAIAVSFLQGKQSPELFSEDGWSVDGTDMKVRIDFGADDFDYRGAVTDAGV